MKRQLKFRVWNKLEKRFIYPDKGYQGHYVLSLGGKFHNLKNGSGGDEYEVQQFTGLIDKNNKDVYERDLVKVTSEIYVNENYIAEVKFDSSWGVVLFVNRGVYRGGVYSKDMEVIGNVFENPEIETKELKNESLENCETEFPGPLYKD